MRSIIIIAGLCGALVAQAQERDALAEALKLQAARMKIVKQVSPAVCAIFKGQGGGSGVIIHPDGWALSNWHVTSFEKEVRVGLSDHKLYKGTVVGLDPTGDIALVKLHPRVKGKPFPYAPLGDSDALQPGEWVLAMGNPFLLATDFTPTVTLGVVSANHRFLPGQGFNLVYNDTIQIDTPINPGNSGGPLFNMAGEVVGINGRISLRARGRVNIGAGYAIPANTIRNLIGVLRSGHIVERATMNATVRTEDDGRIVINSMFDDSAAAKAGLKLGDELLEFDGVDIKTENAFLNRVWSLMSGWRVKVRVKRGDKEIETWVTLDRIPQRSKPRKGSWQPLGSEWKQQQAKALAAANLGRRGGAADLTLKGTAAGGKPYLVRLTKGQLSVVKAADGEVSFSTGAAKRAGKALPHDEARELRLIWAALPQPADLLAGPRLDKGAVSGSGRLDLVATTQVDYHGPDDERLVFHYHVENERLLGVERFVKDRLTLRVRYLDYRHYGELELPASREVTRFPLKKLGGKDVPAEPVAQVINLSQVVQGEAAKGPKAIAADAPRLRPASATNAAIERTAKALVKIYGAGKIKGIDAFGTGVIVSADGRVLTHNSAMLTTPNLYVVLSDGSRRDAKLVHRAHDRDVAIVQLELGEKETLPFLEPAQNKPIIGQWVMCLGNAFNHAQGSEPLAVNLGILSAKTRLLARRGLADFPYRGDVYVVDAQINPGTYGGPLLDIAGNWIGLSGKILDSKETNTQFHYALPVGAIPDLIAGKPKASTPIATATKKQAFFTGLIFLDAGPFSSPPPYVDRVFPLSPASAAGFKKDDLVIRVGGSRTKSISDVQRELNRHKVGDTVKLSVKRGDEVITLELELEADEDEEEDDGPRKQPETRAEWREEFARQIREEPAPFAKTSAARQLAAMGGAEAAELLAKLLKVADDDIRRAALIGLAALGADAANAVEVLTGIAGGGRREDLRAEAALALGAIGPKAAPATPELVALLIAPQRDVRQAAIQAISGIGPAALDGLIAELQVIPPAMAIEAIAKQPKAAAPKLIAALAKANNAPYQRALCLALGACGAEAAAAIPALSALAGESKSASVREAALEALAQTGKAEVTATIAARLDKDLAGAVRALSLLGQQASAALPQVSARFNKSKDAGQRARLLELAAAIGDPATQLDVMLALATEACKDDALLPTRDLPALLAACGAKALPQLRALLKSESGARVELGCVVASRLELKAAPLVDELLTATRHAQGNVRALALESLGRAGLKGPKVNAALSRGLNDATSAVRWGALLTLRRNKVAPDAAITGRLIDLAKRSINEMTRELALLTLADTLKAPKAAAYEELFVAATGHYDANCRAAGAYGLGKLEGLGAKGFDALLGGFNDEDVVRAASLVAFTKQGKAGIPTLIKGLAGDAFTRFLSVGALKELGADAAPATGQLVKLLGDARYEVRQLAAEALGALGKAADKTVVPALIGALDDEKAEVADAAVKSLQALTGKPFKLASEWKQMKAWDPDATDGDKE